MYFEADMASVESEYSVLLPRLNELERQVQSVLSLYTSGKDFLLAQRVKSLSSVSDKIETGRYASLNAFDDLVAFTIIINTRAQQTDVLRFLKKTFDVVEVRGDSTLADERVFDFDAVRVYARLRVSDPTSVFAKMTFEIQIRTLLQHAWSKITHPLVYKPENIDPKKIRLAAEILAAIEGLDRNLSTFATSAKLVKRVKRRRTEDLNRVISLIDDLVERGIIPSELRPSNGRRFAENVLRLIDLRRVKLHDVLAVLKKFFEGQAAAFPYSATLHQLALIALKRADMLAPHRNKTFYYVTPELVSLFPDAATLEPRFRLS